MLHRFDGFVRCQDRVCEKRVIDERRRIAVAPFGMLWPSRRIFYDQRICVGLAGHARNYRPEINRVERG